MAHARAAIFFGNGSAQPTHFSELTPQILIKGLFPFQSLADNVGGAFVQQKAPGLIAQHALVVIELKIHIARPLLSDGVYFPLSNGS
jgi:hypothetical protein